MGRDTNTNTKQEENKIKYSPKKELIVLKTVEELGLASIGEIIDFIAENLPKTRLKFNRDEVSLICERWKARDLLSIDLSHEEKRYKLARTPAYFRSCKMINIVNLKNPEAKKVITEIEKLFPDAGQAIRPPKGKIGDYVAVELLIETIDPILGGTPSNEDKLKLRRDHATGLPCITPAQFRGWVRSNLRLVDWNVGAFRWIAYSLGIPENEPKLMNAEAPVVVKGRGVGIVKYEAFVPGTKLRTTWRVPMRGQRISGIDDIKELFELCSIAPVRGLGANPFYYGGRVKLLEINKI